MKRLLLFFFLLFSIPTQAQIFPIQSTPQLIPPYSVNLPDYALNDKLRLVLLQRDLSQPSYNLRLRMKIELNGKVIMQTTQGYNPAPIQVSPGLPLIVTGPELLPYLDARNMDFIGYSRDQYLKSKSLPEGAFTISFTAYDFYRPTVQVSNEGSVFAYLMKAEPPMINLPFCGTVIPNQPGGSIMFQWLPRNTSSPNSAMNTEYVFELFEIRPKGANPNAVVQQLRPVFTHRQSNSTFIYGPAEPLLLDSMQYAWRVQAVDLSGTDLFRNRGYSEVCTFTYGGVPPGTSRLTRISNVQAEGLTTRMGKVSWTACENYEGCKVSYRKPGKENVWFEQETSDSTVRIQKLEPSTDYEVRVQGRKGSMFGPSSETVSFRTKDQVDYSCGEPSPDFVKEMLANASPVPLGMLTPGDVVTVGLFEMHVTKGIARGGGRFSGEGYVNVPFLNQLNFEVTFDDMLINEDLISLDGEAEVVSRADLKTVADDYAREQKEGVQQDNREEYKDLTDIYKELEEFPLPIAGLKREDIVYNPQDHSLGVRLPDGTVQKVQLPEGSKDQNIILEDKNGDQLVVKKDGTVEKVIGGGLSPGMNVKVTEYAIDIIKKAIYVLRDEYKGAKLRKIKADFEAAEKKYDAEVKRNNEGIKASVLTAGGGKASAEKMTDIISSMESEAGNSDEQSKLGTLSGEYLVAETAFNRSQIIQAFARETTSTDGYELIAKNLWKGDQQIVTYLEEQKKAAVAENQLVEETKAALIELVETIITKNIYGTN